MFKKSNTPFNILQFSSLQIIDETGCDISADIQTIFEYI